MVEPFAIGMQAALRGASSRAMWRWSRAPVPSAYDGGAGGAGGAAPSGDRRRSAQPPSWTSSMPGDGIETVNIRHYPLAAAVAEATDGWGADVVFECSGAAPAILAWRRWRPGGAIVLVGMPVDPVPVDIVGLQAKELRVETVFRYANVYDRAIALIAWQGGPEAADLGLDPVRGQHRRASIARSRRATPTSNCRCDAGIRGRGCIWDWIWGTSGIRRCWWMRISDHRRRPCPLTVSRPHPGWSEQAPADWIAGRRTGDRQNWHASTRRRWRGCGDRLSGHMHGPRCWMPRTRCCGPVSCGTTAAGAAMRGTDGAPISTVSP